MKSALLLVVAIAAVCRFAPGQGSPIIGLSGDDTRHGVVVLHGSFSSSHEVEVTRYHVDTLIQTRFARTKLETEIRNNAAATRNIIVPFAIPTNAMLVNFEIESDGKIHQARPVLKDAIQVDSLSTSATIKARDAEAFDVDLELASGATIVLRLEYEEMLVRRLQRYTNVQQIWPGAIVQDLRVSVRIREATAIVDDVAHSLTAESASKSLQELVSNSLVKVSKVQQPEGLTEVTLTLKPSVSQQRELARQLGLDSERGLAGQFNVNYDVERYPDAGDIVVRDGHFAHFFAPSDLNDTTALPKYALFLLDVSGSMSGEKISQLQDAMDTILGDLSPNDFFTVIEFSDNNEIWDLGATPVSSPCATYSAASIPAAQARAAQMKAQGGTALLGGMQQALECAKDAPAGLEPILLVLTDGQPNEPTTDIISQTGTLNRPNGNEDLLVSVFTLAFGTDANLDFLNELALKNGGSSKQIYVATDASVQLRDFYRSIATPLLTDVSVAFDYQEVEQATLTQVDFRTFFSGSELVVAGRLLPGHGDKLTGEITATGAGGLKVRYPIQVSARPNWNPERLGGEANAKRLWAFLRTSQLLDQAVIDGANSAAATEAIDLALEHSFVTSHTCLAVDIVNPYQASTSPDPDDWPTQSPTNWPSGLTTDSSNPTGLPYPTGSVPTWSPNPPTPTGGPRPTGSPYDPTGSPYDPTGSPIPTGPPGPPGPTGPPGPPNPTGSPKPPRPTGGPGPVPTVPGGGQGSIQNIVSVGSISVDTLTVNGPLIQFNLR